MLSADLWNKRLIIARRNLKRMTNTSGAPDYLLADCARSYLEAFHKGPSRLLLAIARHDMISLWDGYGWAKWEWIRTRVLRREPDSVLVAAQRVADEMEQVEKLNGEL